MYDKRIKILIALSSLLLVIYLLRLAQMQLLTASSVKDEIAELKRRRSDIHQLKTLRGRILDRKGKELAIDRPCFYLCINYSLSCYFDERVWQAQLLEAAEVAQRTESDKPLLDKRQQLEEKRDDLENIIDKCTGFGYERTEIENDIQRINDRIWNLRTFLAWRRNNPDPNIIEKYGGNIGSVLLSEAVADLEKNYPDQKERTILIGKVDDIPEMSDLSPLLELKTDEDIFTAQLEFRKIKGVEIQLKGQRFYPYGDAAAQTIGWVGKATQQQDMELFADDRLSSYLEDEVCGRQPGVEYVCETILRGRRGEIVYDIDRRLISRTETQFGRDVMLTLDIELQKKLENYLLDFPHDPNSGPGMAAVVIDVTTSNILALVSLPVYDLNTVKYKFNTLDSDPNRPMINRAINERYPPGSVVKPLILIAGLETGSITPDEIISCPGHAPPEGWPRCLIFRTSRVGHDSRWENIARNAIKGSCNIYFSHLADRIDSSMLQQWLYAFGYGRDILSLPDSLRDVALTEDNRDFLQLAGLISSITPKGDVVSLEEMPPISDNEKRYYGIGQGTLLATPLQVANEMALIARGGIFKMPNLFLETQAEDTAGKPDGVDLGISPETMAVVLDGMSAVVNEYGGTANRQFAPVLRTFADQDTKIYGKTGSTEDPEVAWFAGFAEDRTGHKLAVAVVVEGGQHGSSDAAPLARDIIQYCIEAGYIGKSLY
jgi:penicillin-binding protein 2